MDNLTENQLAAVGGMMVVYLLVCAICSILVIVAWWKIFKKAGRHGWAAIVPFYNVYTLFKISTGKATKFWIMMIAGMVGSVMYTLYTGSATNNGTGNAVYAIVGAVAMLTAAVVTIMMEFKLAKAFGHGVPFGFGLWFLNPIFMLILGFGGSRYIGAAGVAPAQQ